MRWRKGDSEKNRRHVTFAEFIVFSSGDLELIESPGQLNCILFSAAWSAINELLHSLLFVDNNNPIACRQF